MPLKDREKRRLYAKDYDGRRYASNRDTVKARTAAYARAHPERARAWRRRSALMLNFGITLEQYDAMRAAQDGRCLLCGKTDGEKSLSVDHDHTTGRVRGLLCGRCNTCLERFEMDGWRDRADEYLAKYKEEQVGELIG